MNPPQAPNRTLLIVNDEAGLAEALEPEFVDANKVRCLIAHDGREALEVIGRERVDAIVSDTQLPGMSGLALLAQLRDCGNRIPFVIVSVHADRMNTVQALRLGAFDFLEKPFDVRSLRDTVGRALEVGWSRNQLESKLDSLCADSKVPSDQLTRFREAVQEVLLLKSTNRSDRGKTG